MRSIIRIIDSGVLSNSVAAEALNTLSTSTGFCSSVYNTIESLSEWLIDSSTFSTQSLLLVADP